ncbi:hypothetical protein MMC12_007020 [Toensbergia leucococca]|nr:hypothetical protein [Toensbergia leucococca]
MHIPFFRIFYSTTFTVLTLILVGLLIITPGEVIYQGFQTGQRYDIFAIAGVYLITVLIAVLIYASRLYTNRTVLAAIPKNWIPIGKADVASGVQRLISANLARSASIAHEARPKDLRQDKGRPDGRLARPNRTPTETDNAPKPAWGTISHPGWSSPSSTDLPNLQYEPVIVELSHLIEAKAVSLAPADPLSQSDPEALLPDALAVELLQRPATLGLRDYLDHLISNDMIHPPSLGTDFLVLYEKARFSGQELNEPEFRSLMNIFADILRGMKTLDLATVAELHAEQDSVSDLDNMDGGSLTSTETVERTPRPEIDGHIQDYWSMPRSETEIVAPIHAGYQSQRNMSTTSGSTASTNLQAIRTTSSKSLRKIKTSVSAASQRSGGSVIRLTEARAPLDLPYTILPASEME